MHTWGGEHEGDAWVWCIFALRCIAKGWDRGDMGI